MNNKSWWAGFGFAAAAGIAVDLGSTHTAVFAGLVAIGMWFDGAVRDTKKDGN